MYEKDIIHIVCFKYLCKFQTCIDITNWSGNALSTKNLTQKAFKDYKNGTLKVKRIGGNI